MHYRMVRVKTGGTGAFTERFHVGGKVLRVIEVAVGDLSTPDIDITQEPASESVLSVNGLAADARYYPQVAGQDSSGVDISVPVDDGGSGTSNVGPFVSPYITDDVEVAITGGGANKSGSIRFVFE